MMKSILSTEVNTPPPPPPPSAPSKGSRKTLLAVILIVIIVVAAVAGAYLLTRGGSSSTNPTPSPGATTSPSASVSPGSTTSPSASVSPGSSTPSPSPNPVAGASSLQFSVSYTTSTQTMFAYTYSAKNIGTPNMMMRIEGTFSNDSSNMIIMINGAQQTYWVYSDGEWTDMSSIYTSQYDSWNATLQGYETSLLAWAGTGEYTYTLPGTDETMRIYNIAVNPTLADSLFQHS
jgi:hypothetical protein